MSTLQVLPQKVMAPVAVSLNDCVPSLFEEVPFRLVQTVKTYFTEY